MTQVIAAAWVWTGEALLRDAAVKVEQGRIVQVGEVDRDGAEVVELGASILIPGLINAHTHLELTGIGRDPDGGRSFTDWILSLQQRVMAAGDREMRVPEAVRAGIAQSLGFGVTSVGDISQHMDLSRKVLAEAPIRSVSYGEVLGLGPRRRRFEELLPMAIDRRHQRGRLRVGLTPHAPYTVDRPGYQRCLQLAREQDLRLATHLAETPDEQAFLEHHAGAFRRLWETIGTWEEPVETFPGTPILFASAIGLLDHPTLLAHVNYCTDAELQILARGKASVVYCPRTHAYFGHRPHRFQEMLAAGINVAVGTDSCASSPDLDVMAELRLLHANCPDLAPETILRMATAHAAMALQMDAEVGSIEPGKRADLVAFPIAGASPLLQLLETQSPPSHVWVDGELIRGPSSGRS